MLNIKYSRGRYNSTWVLKVISFFKTRFNPLIYILYLSLYWVLIRYNLSITHHIVTFIYRCLCTYVYPWKNDYVPMGINYSAIFSTLSYDHHLNLSLSWKMMFLLFNYTFYDIKVIIRCGISITNGSIMTVYPYVKYNNMAKTYYLDYSKIL